MQHGKREFLKAAAGVAALAAVPRTAAQTAAPWQPSQRYPDPSVKIVDPSFGRYRLGLAKVERIASGMRWNEGPVWLDRKSTRLNSSHLVISYAVFCLKKKRQTHTRLLTSPYLSSIHRRLHHR